jgi:hypothetical protein
MTIEIRTHLTGVTIYAQILVAIPTPMHIIAFDSTFRTAVLGGIAGFSAIILSIFFFIPF